MEEGEVFEWTDPVHLVDDLIATKAGAFIEIRAVHGSWHLATVINLATRVTTWQVKSKIWQIKS